MNILSHRVSGSNQTGVRQYNERVIISLIREHGALTKAELAKATSLTPQTTTTIINRLCEQNLLLAGQKRRGERGQPSTPYRLNPEGAFSIGIKLGRASLDVILMDFTGHVRARADHNYPFPAPKEVFEKIDQSINALLDSLTDDEQLRVVGVGLASPFGLEGWGEEFPEAKEILSEWASIDILKEVSRLTHLEVSFLNDASAACLAEIAFGNKNNWTHFIYIYIGTFIGGGLVLDGKIWTGSRSNAGAIGSVPSMQNKQLIHHASLHQLDKKMQSLSVQCDFSNLDEKMTPDAWSLYTAWANDAAPHIANMIAAGSAFIDPDGVVIDGRLPSRATEYLVKAINEAAHTINWEGMDRPTIHSGHLGFDARALGGALLPLYSNFGMDNQAFLKVPV